MSKWNKISEVGVPKYDNVFVGLPCFVTDSKGNVILTYFHPNEFNKFGTYYDGEFVEQDVVAWMEVEFPTPFKE